MMTKAEEKALLAEMIEHCPEGYVKDILEGSRLDIERAIDNDFGFVPFREFFKQQQEAAAELLKLQKQVREERDALIMIERNKKGLERELSHVREQISQLARLSAALI